MSGIDGTGASIDPRGVLYPARLPTFHRVEAPPGLSGLVRWFWIPEWRLAPGRSSRQELLPFPASNLVVGPDAVTLAGPTTSASHRDLTGSNWAVGMLLRPAALMTLVDDPGTLRDVEVPFAAPSLHGDVVAAMAGQDRDAARSGAVRACQAWCADRFPTVDVDGLLANRMEEIVAGDRDIVRVEQLAARLGVGVRAVQRLAQRSVGLPPLTIIRRYRLQEAAQRLRDDADVTIAQVAADLGYADHAHLTSDFRRVLGLTPTGYRRDPDNRPDR
ncbi:AraC family transcriptional regulator [Plantibacter sp. Leaf171]|uniref:helix-turn-helix domain-containing protein n=1 Tax=unclassified Plantibacter TaxID=2624265 RepID=UPI0006FCC4B1|nr:MULTISPECIES: helix-turn-helix domain-containing protein [unclassified Plantibacter]KQM16041.1 AraC family transcriptional regulator [Plantibacter sp. Leaf1]KQR59181.1 AraC family transcriptional regulator [Plantibacter sp. Leaf171]